jgi:hypothetical protein
MAADVMLCTLALAAQERRRLARTWFQEAVGKKRWARSGVGACRRSWVDSGEQRRSCHSIPAMWSRCKNAEGQLTHAKEVTQDDGKIREMKTGTITLA